MTIKTLSGCQSMVNGKKYCYDGYDYKNHDPKHAIFHLQYVKEGAICSGTPECKRIKSMKTYCLRSGFKYDNKKKEWYWSCFCGFFRGTSVRRYLRQWPFQKKARIVAFPPSPTHSAALSTPLATTVLYLTGIAFTPTHRKTVPVHMTYSALRARWRAPCGSA